MLAGKLYNNQSTNQLLLNMSYTIVFDRYSIRLHHLFTMKFHTYLPIN